MAASCAVIRNPYAGRYEPDLMPFMQELRSLGTLLATELVETLGGKQNVEVYSKAAIVGLEGEMEHGAVWHEAADLRPQFGPAGHVNRPRSFDSQDGVSTCPPQTEMHCPVT